MRKTVSLFGLILLAVFVLLSFLDNDDYALEKRLWRMKKDFLVIAQDPSAVSPQKTRKTISDYQRLLTEFPNADRVPVVLLQIGRIHVLREEWAEARKVFEDLLAKYPKSENFAEQALL